VSKATVKKKTTRKKRTKKKAPQRKYRTIPVGGGRRSVIRPRSEQVCLCIRCEANYLSGTGIFNKDSSEACDVCELRALALELAGMVRAQSCAYRPEMLSQPRIMRTWDHTECIKQMQDMTRRCEKLFGKEPVIAAALHFTGRCDA